MSDHEPDPGPAPGPPAARRDPNRPTYTRRHLARGIDDARYLAFRHQETTWTVEIVGTIDRFENLVAPSLPHDRRAVAAWTPSGEPLDVSSHGAARASHKAYTIYARTDPPRAIGQVRGQTRAQAHALAREQFGPLVMVAISGVLADREIASQLEREGTVAKALDDRQARRQTREQRERERDERRARAPKWGDTPRASPGAPWPPDVAGSIERARLAALENARHEDPTDRDRAITEAVARDQVDRAAEIRAAGPPITPADSRYYRAGHEPWPPEDIQPTPEEVASWKNRLAEHLPRQRARILASLARRKADLHREMTGHIARYEGYRHATEPEKADLETHTIDGWFTGIAHAFHTIAQARALMVAIREHSGEASEEAAWTLPPEPETGPEPEPHPVEGPDDEWEDREAIAPGDDRYDDDPDDREYRRRLETQTETEAEPEPEPAPEPEPEGQPHGPAPKARRRHQAASPPDGFQVYRPTPDGILWAGPPRLRHKRDPQPIVNHRSPHSLGPGTALSWQTERRRADTFPTRRQAESRVMAQGWRADEIRVVDAHQDPGDQDEPPAYCAVGFHHAAAPSTDAPPPPTTRPQLGAKSSQKRTRAARTG